MLSIRLIIKNYPFGLVILFYEIMERVQSSVTLMMNVILFSQKNTTYPLLSPLSLVTKINVNLFSILKSVLQMKAS